MAINISEILTELFVLFMENICYSMKTNTLRK